MKTNLLSLLAVLVSLNACHQPDEVAPHEDVTALQEKFNGTYKPLEAVSSLALDVNQDGQASTDMLQEISELPHMVIEVKISRKHPFGPKPASIFVHHWPAQWLGREEPTGYDPRIKPAYDRKVVHWLFAFDKDLTQLFLEPNPTYLANPEVYSPLETVLVKGNGRIEVTLSKRLYTTAGWKTVQIVTLYERMEH